MSVISIRTSGLAIRPGVEITQHTLQDQAVLKGPTRAVCSEMLDFR